MHHCWYSGRFEQTLLKINLSPSRKLRPRILLVLCSESHLQCFPSSFPFGLTQCCWGIFIQDNDFQHRLQCEGCGRRRRVQPQCWKKEGSKGGSSVIFLRNHEKAAFLSILFSALWLKQGKGRAGEELLNPQNQGA